MTANPETFDENRQDHPLRSPQIHCASPNVAPLIDVTAENRSSGRTTEEYVHIRVILEYDHPKLDPHARTNGSFPVETTRDTKR